MGKTWSIAGKAVAPPMLLLALASGGAAEPVDLRYRAVMHVREVHSVQVLDDPEHAVGVAVFRGLAIFPDDEVAVHRYEGWFDLTSGSGNYRGYASWSFPDGSELRARYDGSIEKVAEDRFEVRAAVHEIEGTMRFEGATGTGAFEGRRIEPLEVGGATYLTGALDIETPE